MAMNALRVAAKESKFMKFILGGFIFLAVGGLVFTDINGFFRGGLPNTTVAQVGNVEISAREFDNGLRGFLQQAQITAEDAYASGLVNAYLQSRIDTILEAQATDDLNINISNQAIAGELKKVFANASRDEIESSLRARGMSETQMASIIRDQIRTQIITNLPQGVSNYKPAFLSGALTRANNEQRSGVLYTFPASRLSDDIVISDDDVESYYNENLLEYAIPEERIFTIGQLSIDDVAKSIAPPTDEDLRADYDARIDDFTTFETREIEQIVANDPDEAQKIYELALSGINLKDAAIQAGADVKTYRPAAKYEENGLPDELSFVAFDAGVEKDAVLPPVKTLIGWHVMKVVGIQEPEQTPFEQVKADIRKTMVEQSKYDALYDRIIRTEELVDSGDSFQSIVEKTGLKTKTTQSVTEMQVTQLPQNLQDAISQNPSIGQEIFSLDENKASYPVETDDGGYIVVGVNKLKPMSYKPLTDVSESIRQILKNESTASIASSKLSEIMNNLQNGSVTLSDIAKTYRAKTNRFNNIGISSTKYDAALIFNTDLNGFNAQVNDDNEVQISTVTGIRRDDSKKANASVDEKQNFMNIFNAAENIYYRTNTDITVNQELLAAQYSGQ